VLGLIGGAVCIGFAPILVRLSDLAPPASAFWRMLVATAVLAPVATIDVRRAPAAAAEGAPRWLWLVLPGLFFGGDLAVWHWSIAWTTPANATLEANFAGILVSIIGWRFFGERFRPIFVVGLGVALLGAAALLGVSFQIGPQQMAGDGLGFATAFFYAGYLLSSKRLRGHFRVAPLMAVTAAASLAVLFPVAWLTPGRFWPVGGGQWGVILGLALGVHCVGQGLIIWALARLPASFSAVSLLIQPVVAAVVGWLLLGIALSPLEIAGGTAVVIGIVLARLGSVLPAAETAAGAGAESS